MNVLATRRRRVTAAVLVQLVLVPLAVAGSLSARLTGEEYLLEVAPLDPIDPFRGAYVDLDYPGLPRASRLPGSSYGDTVYVPLVRDGELWKGRRPMSERPDSGPYLRCVDDDWRLACGIESLFLPQDEALAMERELLDRPAVATVRIDSRGNAALVDVQARD